MSFFLGARRAQANFEGLLLRLRRQLEEQYSTTEGTGLSFIHPEETGRILTREVIHDLFNHFSWYEKNHDDLWQSMRLIICTLISFGWNDWERFPRYFFRAAVKSKYARYLDRDLPISRTNFLDYVPSDFAGRFLFNQHIFKPVFIEEGSHRLFSKEDRLPILKNEPLGEGAQSVVEKVTIEGKFLHYANKTWNHKPQVMAYKRIKANTDDGQHDFETEQRALKQFRVSISQNSNIMQSFASFVLGSDFVILLPFAAGQDLNRFLRTPDAVLDNYAERSWRFSPDNLLTEAYNLARALHFLHFELLSARSRRLCCAHADLKPENVLVEFLPDERDAPVGRWKISDFGLSKVEEVVTENRVMPMGREEQEASRAPGNIAGELSFQPRARGPGAFQPPEVHNQNTPKVSTRRDVWSYGCILAMVLAFALGGPQGVEEQGRRRAVGGDDYFYRHSNRRSRTPGPSPEGAQLLVDAELKPGIGRWLDTAAKWDNEIHRNWIKPCTKLIFNLLDVNVITRPEINEAITVLDNVTIITEHDATERLWSFDEQLRPPPLSTVFLDIAPDTRPDFGSHSPGGDSPSSSSVSASAPMIAPVHRTTTSNRSSVSRISLSSAPDPSLWFERLEPPRGKEGTGAALDPSGRSAALWCSTEVRLYALGDELMFLDKPVKNGYLELDNTAKAIIRFPELTECLQVRLSGRWIAILERVRQAQCHLAIYFRPVAQQAKHRLFRKIALPQKPQQFEISSQGVLTARFLDRVVLYLDGGSAPIALTKAFAGMGFSGNGDYFCLWESDDAYGGNFYWTVWSLRIVGSQTEVVVLGQTISHVIEACFLAGSYAHS